MPTILRIPTFTLIAVTTQGQDSPSRWAILAGGEYRVISNIIYKRANHFECKLDIIISRDSAQSRPTLIYIHGGGWIAGNKENTFLRILPYLERGMNIVNVEYRLAAVSLAPAAVEDCRCALRWIFRNATNYGFDLDRLVVSGHSAGGHLSLMVGMLTRKEGFDSECPGDEALQVSAIINFYGITDVADLLEGVHRQDYAVRWFGALQNRKELAHRVSPLNYVRQDLPPILTIHGDKDTVVPYQQGVRLHRALTQVGVSNELVTIPGAKHGSFSQEQRLKIYDSIFSFLQRQGVLETD